MNHNELDILIIEDEEFFRKHLVNLLAGQGNITDTDCAITAKDYLTSNYYDLVIIDIDLYGKEEGFNLLTEAKRKNIFSIILTDNDDEGYVERAYQLGCDHYLTKDQCENVILFIVKNRIDQLANKFTPDFFCNEYITSDPDLIGEISSLNNRLIGQRPVLLMGETGTGKTKLAQYVHMINGGEESNFITINISSIPDNLVESELFGHIKGAFTGADKNKKGLLQMADQGTLFLDEITSMSLLLQKKLLKCLEEKIFYPVGSTIPVKSNFRLVTSTCDDIFKLIQDNQFRLDLFYRINGITLTIPPLRQRRHDIPLLIKHFLERGSRRVFIKKVAMDKMVAYDWFGNIRELKNVVDNFSLKSNGEIVVDDLPKHIVNNENIIREEKGKKFVTQEQMAYTQKYGIKSLMEKIQLDIVKEVSRVFEFNAKKSREVLKLSKTGYYQLYQKVIEKQKERVSQPWNNRIEQIN